MALLTVELMAQPGPITTAQLKLAALYSGCCSRKPSISAWALQVPQVTL